MARSASARIRRWRSGTRKCARSGWSTVRTKCTSGRSARTSSRRSASTAPRQARWAGICCRPNPSFRGGAERRTRNLDMRSAYRTEIPDQRAMRVVRNDRLTRSLLFHRLPGDVAAAETIRPFDAVDSLVGTLLRLQHRLPDRADVQDTPAIGENGAVLCHRAGMEDLDALDSSGVIESVDARALVVIAGIAL